jgi:hypothetical protein
MEYILRGPLCTSHLRKCHYSKQAYEIEIKIRLTKSYSEMFWHLGEGKESMWQRVSLRPNKMSPGHDARRGCGRLTGAPLELLSAFVLFLEASNLFQQLSTSARIVLFHLSG